MRASLSVPALLALPPDCISRWPLLEKEAPPLTDFEPGAGLPCMVLSWTAGLKTAPLAERLHFPTAPLRIPVGS